MGAEFVSYLRTSTRKQEIGIDAQRLSIEAYVASIGGTVISEHIEHASGKRDDRPILWQAIEQCKATGANLICAKVDRLSRSIAFLFTLRDKLTQAGVNVVISEMPDVISDTMRLGIYATVAQAEREFISKRTRQALSARREQGVIGGRKKGCDIHEAQAEGRASQAQDADMFAETYRPIIEGLRDKGSTLQEIADILNRQGIKTRRGSQWTPTTVRNAILRLRKLEANKDNATD